MRVQIQTTILMAQKTKIKQPIAFLCSRIRQTFKKENKVGMHSLFMRKMYAARKHYYSNTNTKIKVFPKKCLAKDSIFSLEYQPKIYKKVLQAKASLSKGIRSLFIKDIGGS
jgi:hypothetical protein